MNMTYFEKKFCLDANSGEKHVSYSAGQCQYFINIKTVQSFHIYSDGWRMLHDKAVLVQTRYYKVSNVT